MPVNKKMKTDEAVSLESLKAVKPVLEAIEDADWNVNSIHDAAFKLIEQLGVKNGVILFPLRVAISGKQFTPGGAFEIAALIGKKDTLSRLDRSIEKLENR